MTVIAASSVNVKTMADDTLRLTVDIEPRHAQEAFAMFGSRGTPLALARLTQSAAGEAMAKDTESEARPGGQMMRDIIAYGVFNNPKVLAALGTDKQFQDYVRGLPSCLNGDDYGIVYAHVRRANNSGTSIKPNYSGVPLTDPQHSQFQHQSGERAALEAWKPKAEGWTVQDAKDWFDKQAAKCRIDWGKARILDWLKSRFTLNTSNYQSCAEFVDCEIASWFHENDLPNALPAKWRDA